METALKIVFTILFIAAFPAAFASVSAENRLSRYLKQHHPDEFLRLGKPSIWNGRANASSRFSRYVARGEYRASNDSELIRLGNVARVCVHIAASLFLAVILFILGISAFSK